MKVSAIIAEYNPLHNGHLYHINKTKEITNSDALICVMSGNFVQRGVPAIIDKWKRTEMLLNCGVDLIIELPAIYAVSSAEFFAFGAISLLNNLNIVDYLSFGSEYGEIETINKIANILVAEPISYKTSLKNYLSEGCSFPLARGKALIDYLPIDSLMLSSSNNILGIEYCKSLLRLNSNIIPITVKRQGSNYNDISLGEEYCSASAIRKVLKEGENLENLHSYIPSILYAYMNECIKQGTKFTFKEDMIPYIRYKYFSGSKSFSNLPDVSEGIDNKIFRALEKYDNYDDIINYSKSKRYSYTRLSRILCQFFMGFDHFDTKVLRTRECSYARILGFNDTGREILKEIKKKSIIPYYTKLPKTLNDSLKLDLQATNTYSLINSQINYNDDYFKNLPKSLL